MATVLRAPDRLTAAQKRTTTTLYLAGPFDDADTWRDEVIGAYDDLDITVIDPRNERWPQLEVGSPGRRGAFEWQCAAAFDADVVIVWVPAGRHAPTALMILGSLVPSGTTPSGAARWSSGAADTTDWCSSSPRTSGCSRPG
jgi:hypothetical protein